MVYAGGHVSGGHYNPAVKVSTTLDGLLEWPDDQRIAVEGGLQRVASVIVMQELFAMA
jgi:asparagine synthase (glutamine-hydrolysing)